MKSDRIAIVGAGHIGKALIRGFLASGKCSNDQLMATIPSTEKADRLQEELGIRLVTDNKEASSWADVIVFCVKPQVLASVLTEVSSIITGEKLVVSVAAGIHTRFIEDCIEKEVPVIRLMPNVAVVARQGATGMCWGRFVKEEHVKYVRDLFSSVGLVMEMEEGLMDAVTGLSGTGPMYIFQVIEGLSDAGVKVGLSREKAYKLAVQTVLGAAMTARDSEEHPGHLKDLVTSPAGTAISALHLMERSGFRAILMDAVEEATRRAGELGKMYMEESS
ncbi:MAG: pyrroline-5-carboxylate reductase [Thermoplasmata archaeon]